MISLPWVLLERPCAPGCGMFQVWQLVWLHSTLTAYQRAGVTLYVSLLARHRGKLCHKFQFAYLT